MICRETPQLHAQLDPWEKTVSVGLWISFPVSSLAFIVNFNDVHLELSCNINPVSVSLMLVFLFSVSLASHHHWSGKQFSLFLILYFPRCFWIFRQQCFMLTLQLFLVCMESSVFSEVRSIMERQMLFLPIVCFSVLERQPLPWRSFFPFCPFSHRLPL